MLVPLPRFFVYTTWNNELFFAKLGIHTIHLFTKNAYERIAAVLPQCAYEVAMQNYLNTPHNFIYLVIILYNILLFTS